MAGVTHQVVERAMRWGCGCGWGRAATGLTGGGLLLICASAVNAQTAGAVPSGLSEIKAVRATKPPIVDGVIGDGEWEQAATAANFTQY